jgi:hypothetical protein
MNVKVINDVSVLIITTPGPQGPVGAAGSADEIRKGGASITINDSDDMSVVAAGLDIASAVTVEGTIIQESGDFFVQEGTIYGDGSGLTNVNRSYTHTQNLAATVWIVNHNMGRNPSITTVDTLGRPIFGEVQYVTTNQILVTFSTALSGTAYLN